MEKISVELETITATFLHVEPEGEARWRAAPFRGLLRWWYRAIVGSACPVEEVRKREADLFGATFGAPVSQSRVSIRVFSEAHETSRPFSVNPKQDRKLYSRQALAPGSKARLEITPTHSSDIAAMNQAYVCLWAAIHLGGIGQRSRRGAGSLRMINVVASNGLPQPVTQTESESHARALQMGIREVRRILNADRLGPLPTGNDFPVLHPESATVQVASLRGTSNETTARQYIMDLRRDHHRPHGDTSGEYEMGAVKPYRLSSPLWVRVADLSEDRTIIVLSLFKHNGATARGACWKYADELINDSKRLSDLRTVDLGVRQL